jgi:hypothetical protein
MGEEATMADQWTRRDVSACAGSTLVALAAAGDASGAANVMKAGDAGLEITHDRAAIHQEIVFAARPSSGSIGRSPRRNSSTGSSG